MRTFALIAAVMALTASACSSGSDSSDEEQPGPGQDTTASAPAAHYTKSQLPKIALRPSDAPDGMRYVKSLSGMQTLDDVGFILDSQIAEVRELKLRGIYDTTFDSKKKTSDLRLASRLWLFADEDGAQKWLDKTESDSQQFAFEALEPPRLGEDSWGGYGNLAAQVLTYAFRKGNVVVVTSYTTEIEELSQQAALAAAQKAAQRVGEA